MQMEPNTTELPLNDPATGLNGAAPAESAKKSRAFNGRAGRPDHDELKRLVIAAAELKPRGFSTAHVAGWIRKAGRKAWSPNFVNKFVKDLSDDGLIQTTGTCRKKRRLYVLAQRKNGDAPVQASVAPTVRPTLAEAESALASLDALGIDTKQARAGLEHALKIKAALEAFAPKS